MFTGENTKEKEKNYGREEKRTQGYKKKGN
jgi:hypothetical protein